MTRTEKLLSISSEALGAKLDVMPEHFEKYALGPELFQMLQGRVAHALDMELLITPIRWVPRPSRKPIL
jgi:hypothetical protein